jgi:hypothetical protein
MLLCFLVTQVSYFVQYIVLNFYYFAAESAAGKFPIESVTMQQLVINKVETDVHFKYGLDRYAQQIATSPVIGEPTSAAITIAVRQVYYSLFMLYFVREHLFCSRLLQFLIQKQ